MTTPDHLTAMRGRLLEQYKGLPNLDVDLQVSGAQFNELEDAMQALIVGRRLSQAVGAVLDRWGVLLNTPRFGLSDTDYRGLLFARIAQYNSRATPEDLINIATALLRPASGQWYSEPWYPANFLLEALDADPIAPASLLRQAFVSSKPAGVKGWIQLETTPPFGFRTVATDPDATVKGFASLDDVSTVYSQSWAAGTLGQALSAFDISSFFQGGSGSSVIGTTGSFAGKAGFVKNNADNLWAASIYTGRSFSSLERFKYQVKLDSDLLHDVGIVWNIQAATLDGATPVGCYICRIRDDAVEDKVYIHKDWLGGIGSLTPLGSAALPVGFNRRNCTVLVDQEGSTINVYFNGSLTPTLTVVDPSYNSGMTGYQVLGRAHFGLTTVQQYAGAQGGFFSYFL